MKETEALEDHILAAGKPLEPTYKRFPDLSNNGNRLDQKTRDYLEPRYGVNLAQIRKHKDAKANEMVHTL